MAGLMGKIGGLCLALIFGCGLAQANDYPQRSKPVTIIVPYPAGGPGDLLTRAMADILSIRTHGIFIIENKPGASQLIGARAAAQAAPDGYTLLLGSTTSLAINPTTKKPLPYDPLRDFAPISLVVNAPQYLITRPNFPASSMKELVALAKKSPGTLTYASVGPGSTSHLAGELLNAMTGISITHVPYVGAAPAFNDVVAGHVDMTYTTTVLTLIHSGQIKGLGVTSATPVKAAPELSPIADLGIPLFDMGIWMGFLAPAGTPKEIINFLNAEITRAVASGELQKRMGSGGSEFELFATTPEEFHAFIQREIPKWEKIIDTVGAPKQ